MAALVSNKHLMRDGTEARRNPKSMVAILDYLLVWLRKLYEDGFEVWDASTRTYFRFSPCARNFSLVTSMPRDHASVCRCYGTLVRVVADGPALQSLLNRGKWVGLLLVPFATQKATKNAASTGWCTPPPSRRHGPLKKHSNVVKKWT